MDDSLPLSPVSVNPVDSWVVDPALPLMEGLEQAILEKSKQFMATFPKATLDSETYYASKIRNVLCEWSLVHGLRIRTFPIPDVNFRLEVDRLQREIDQLREEAVHVDPATLSEAERMLGDRHAPTVFSVGEWISPAALERHFDWIRSRQDNLKSQVEAGKIQLTLVDPVEGRMDLKDWVRKIFRENGRYYDVDNDLIIKPL